MVRIIETNISVANNKPQDVQSRVIEVSSWDNYVAEIHDNQPVYRSCIIGSLVGESRQKIPNRFTDTKRKKSYL